MEEFSIKKIIRSTVHIVMTDPETLLPKGIGSGCIVKYKDYQILLTVAHVTNKEAATCIITGAPPLDYQTPMYSVGAMNYLEKFDISKYEEQLKLLESKRDIIEETDFGLIDFSFAVLQHKVEFIQNEIRFNEFKIDKCVKLVINTDLTDRPSTEKEYGFFGRIKPLFFKGTPQADTFETQEIFYEGLKFIKKIKNYYEFELPSLIEDHADFIGTSGAPIMGADGELVSLITHGYEGGNKIYGIALADFINGVDVEVMNKSAIF